MRRILVGEWLFAASMLRDIEQLAEVDAETALATRLLVKLAAPLLQEQDLLNRSAEHFANIVQTLDAPWSRYPAALKDAESLEQRVARAPRWASLYNVAGNWLAAGVPETVSYAARIADVEGVRRAALTVLKLRAAQTPIAEVAQALAAAPLRDPYTDAAFTWDEQRHSIVFQGLEPGARGVHRIEY